MRIVKEVLRVYEKTEADEVIEMLAILSAQGESAKQLFLQRSDNYCLIEYILENNTERVFEILQSLCLYKKNANYIWKYKFIDNVLKKLWLLFKGTQRQFKESYSLILSFTKFLAAYTYNECGRKLLQVNFVHHSLVP